MQPNDADNINNSPRFIFLIVIYLGFCYVRRAIWIHYGFKVWPPPDSHTLSYLHQRDKVSSRFSNRISGTVKLTCCNFS